MNRQRLADDAIRAEKPVVSRIAASNVLIAVVSCDWASELSSCEVGLAVFSKLSTAESPRSR